MTPPATYQELRRVTVTYQNRIFAIDADARGDEDDPRFIATVTELEPETRRPAHSLLVLASWEVDALDGYAERAEAIASAVWTVIDQVDGDAAEPMTRWLDNDYEA